MTSNQHQQPVLRGVESLPGLPARPDEGHKGMFGRVLVVGGSEDMIGAPILAGTAALRLGSGLVQVAMPRSVLAAALSVTPELVGLGLDRSRGKGRLIQACQAADAIVVGPGLGKSPAAGRYLLDLVRLDKRMVIDADGLNLLAEKRRWPTVFKAQAVLTPHPGEMLRLGKLLGRYEIPKDDAGRLEVAGEAARAFGQVVVLKGHRTVVTDGRQAYVNQTGDSSLAKGGSGDVLSGIIGCLLGQGVSCFDAAAVGVYLHGRAGELAGQKLGKRSVLSRDVIEALPAAISEYERRRQG
ncbi:MAG TPA: NAD(P)H-hydrate dehydratase [Tepidisphaeraceae bacterium]|nr:NAD(P)H-hydrate dehydratase [Tepidisphaeraceae bacterium]